MPVGVIVTATLRREGHDTGALAAAFDAPFTGIISKAGARRFPVCIPFAEPELGGASLQAETRRRLRQTTVPVHLAFGDADPVFTWAWAEQWAAELPRATLDRIAGAGHFLPIDAPADVLAVITDKVGA